MENALWRIYKTLHVPFLSISYPIRLVVSSLDSPYLREKVSIEISKAIG
jgi:hypothetical protein